MGDSLHARGALPAHSETSFVVYLFVYVVLLAAANDQSGTIRVFFRPVPVLGPPGRLL